MVVLPTPCQFISVVMDEQRQQAPLFKDLRLDYFGWEKCSPGYFWPSHITGFYLIHGVVAGKGILQHNGKTYSLEAGQAFLLTHHDTDCFYRADNQDPWQ